MFLIDAQLPRKLKRVFQNAGFDCIHTLELEDRNATTDADIASIADQQQRIVVTKDGDFRISHQLRGKPKRLLMIATGNCSNRFLTDLLERTLDECVRDAQTEAQSFLREMPEFAFDFLLEYLSPRARARDGLAEPRDRHQTLVGTFL